MTTSNPYEAPQSLVDHAAPMRSSNNWLAAASSFRGRASRKKFWLTLFIFVAMYLLACLGWDILFLLAETIATYWPSFGSVVPPAFAVLVITALIVSFYLVIAVCARRWHDLNRSALWALLCFVPFVNTLVTIFVLGCIRGTPGPNRFGPDPTVDPAIDELVNAGHWQGGRDRVNLDETWINDAQLAAMDGDPSIEELLLSGASITDAGLEHIARLPNLRELDLSLTAVTDAGVASLTSLVSLRTLWLGGTKITDAALAKLAVLPGLADLHVRNTEVTSAGIEQFARLRPDCRVHA